MMTRLYNVRCNLILSNMHYMNERHVYMSEIYINKYQAIHITCLVKISTKIFC